MRSVSRQSEVVFQLKELAVSALWKDPKVVVGHLQGTYALGTHEWGTGFAFLFFSLIFFPFWPPATGITSFST